MEGLENELKNGLENIKAQVKEAAEKNNSSVNELKGRIDSFQNELNNAKENGVSRETIEKMQSHLDSLDIKMQGKNNKEQKTKSFGEVLEKSLLDATDDIAKFERKETKSLILELKAVGDMSTANVTGGSRYGQVNRDGIIPGVNRKVHMSDILPGGSIGPGNSFTFMRENGVGEGAIAPVAEGGSKAQIDMDLVEATVQIETIAGWLRITRKMLNNVPGMVSFLQQRLPEKFQRVLDSQILYGNGTTPNLKGILTSGNFVASTAGASDVLIEKIIKDISKLEDTYERDANGIVLRPADYYSFFLNKASGSGEYDLPQGVTFGADGTLRILGIPVYATTALTSPDYIVGDWQMGAQLLTQEGMRIEFFEQDGNNVTTNKVTVRIEGNYALPVYGPDYFIKGDSTVDDGV